MRVLRLVAVNESGSHLLLRADGDRTEFVLPLDARLRAAVNGDKERFGQLEVQLDSQLRPREIQARVRGGESVESVAHAAGVPFERVMRYASPVLAERAHIADLARRSTLRRPTAHGPALPLDDAVVERLAADGIAADNVSWDAFRREDGRWIVRVEWPGDDSAHSAEWVFDPAARSVLPISDDARWIAGEQPPEPVVSTGPARLTVVPSSPDPAPDRDPAEPASAERVTRTVRPHTHLIDEVAPDDLDDAPTVPVPTVAGHERERPSDLHPQDTDGDATRLRLSDIATHIEFEGDEQPDLDDSRSTTPRVAATGRGRNRRPSVPSWDEIMFGSRHHQE